MQYTSKDQHAIFIRQKWSLILRYALVLMLIAMFAGINSKSVYAAVCYAEWGPAGNKQLVRLPSEWCQYDTLRDSGFEVGGLPSTFPAGSDTCYYSGSTAKVVNCQDPTYKNAPALDPNVVDSTTPPPPDLDTAASGVQGSVENSGDIGGTGSDTVDKWLNTGINVLSALIGIAIVASILIGAIQYITAGSNASQVGAAKQRITMAVLGFGLFLMGYALLQWLIPGGIW